MLRESERAVLLTWPNVWRLKLVLPVENQGTAVVQQYASRLAGFLHLADVYIRYFAGVLLHLVSFSSTHVSHECQTVRCDPNMPDDLTAVASPSHVPFVSEQAPCRAPNRTKTIL